MPRLREKWRRSFGCKMPSAACIWPQTGVHANGNIRLVQREALAGSGVPNVDDRQRICSLAADAVIALAKAGLQPERIRRFARSNLRSMRSTREAAARESDAEEVAERTGRHVMCAPPRVWCGRLDIAPEVCSATA